MATQHKTSLVIPTISDASAGYVTGDALGGLMTFDNAANIDGGGGFVTGINLLMKNPSDTTILDILIFNEVITGGSDATTLNISDADIEKLAGYVSIIASDYLAALAANRPGFKEISIPYKCANNSRDLFAQMVIRETATFGAVSDIAVGFTLFRDE